MIHLLFIAFPLAHLACSQYHYFIPPFLLSYISSPKPTTRTLGLYNLLFIFPILPLSTLFRFQSLKSRFWLTYQKTNPNSPSSAMDIDFMKSSAEEQMEMMLMQMDKLPDFAGTYEIPMMGFSAHRGSNSTIPCNNNNYLENPTYMNLPQPTTISFSGGVHHDPSPSTFLQQQVNSSGGRWKTDDLSGEGGGASQKRNSMAAMREMIFRIAAMQPIHIDPEAVKPPKRRNVKISTDPQSVAARHRRERISERIRILQRLVPGGTKMDTASMLDEAIHYVKFLKNQVQSLERVAANRPAGVGFPVPMSSGIYFPVAGKGYCQSVPPNVQH